VLSDISISGALWRFVNQDETRANLGEVAEAGLTFLSLRMLCQGPRRKNSNTTTKITMSMVSELVEVLRVVFVALAASAVWFVSGSPSTASALSAGGPR